MPDALLDSGSAFDRAKAELGRWLRENFTSTRALSRDVLDVYQDERSFIAGWRINVDHDGRVWVLDVLLERQFPYSAIRVALKSQDVYLIWPHVEPHGLLCLPKPRRARIEDLGASTLSAALELIESCQDPEFVSNELRREFISYWNRSVAPRTTPVHSLLDLTNHQSRMISVWYGVHFTLVGDTRDQVKDWLKHRGQKDSNTRSAIFGYLDEAPIPPFPDTPRALFEFLETHCSEVLAMLSHFRVDRDTTIVLGADSPSGAGLMTIDLEKVSSLNGFRDAGNMTMANKTTLWQSRSHIQRGKVKRFDAGWVHGRGLNQHQVALSAANILVLGCGSLGSQVAMRLAQAGIGNLTLVDPELLETANVGRHALGINSVGLFKAAELAKMIQGRFPHMTTIVWRAESWQAAYTESKELFEAATLIVANLGEWSADGQLGEWQTRYKPAAPIVYGWLDELGVSAHALALASEGPPLDCLLSAEGLVTPETLWDGDAAIQAEPACGTLFQPYGPIDVGRAEALVSQLCIDVLTGNAIPPLHRVHAGSTEQLEAAGGEWSPEHLKHRPAGFTGAFEYTRPIVVRRVCAMKNAKL